MGGQLAHVDMPRPAAGWDSAPQAAGDVAATAREVVQGLVAAHRDGIVLVRELLLAQELADESEVRALREFEVAAVRGGDPASEEIAIGAARVAENANARERRATVRWLQHRQQVERLIARADVVFASPEAGSEAGGRVGRGVVRLSPSSS